MKTEDAGLNIVILHLKVGYTPQVNIGTTSNPKCARCQKTVYPTEKYEHRHTIKAC